MLLRFESPNDGRKWYARTPGGEYAWGEYQGLYEWRNGQRIAYTGADMQISTPEGMHTIHARPEPSLRGFAYALHAYRHNTN